MIERVLKAGDVVTTRTTTTYDISVSMWCHLRTGAYPTSLDLYASTEADMEQVIPGRQYRLTLELLPE